MAPRSRISRLPAENRQKIGELYDAEHMIDEIMQALDGVDASRSSLGRYVRQQDQLGCFFHCRSDGGQGPYGGVAVTYSIRVGPARYGAG